MNFSDPKFKALDITVRDGLSLVYAFHTESSLSLSVFSSPSRSPKGWIDVHYPCAGHIKVKIRGALPSANLRPETVPEITETLLRHLRIPQDETYEALYFKASEQIGIAQPVNREGLTDRIDTTRRFILPKD